MVYFLTQLPRSSAKLVASVTFLVMGLMQQASSVMRMQIAVWQPRWPLDHTPRCWKTAHILRWIVKRVALVIVSIAGSCHILRIFRMDFKNFNLFWAVSTLNATTPKMTSNCNRKGTRYRSLDEQDVYSSFQKNAQVQNWATNCPTKPVSSHCLYMTQIIVLLCSLPKECSARRG